MYPANGGDKSIIKKRRVYMKKLLSSIVLLITAMILCCGCSGGKEPEQNELDKNYNAESVSVKPIVTKLDVVSMKDIEPSKIAKTNIFKVKSAEMTGDTTLLVTYQYYNNASYERSFDEVLLGGGITAYQQGVAVESKSVGDIDQSTNVMAGGTVEIKKQYTLRNNTDPVTLYAASEFFVTVDIFVNKELTLGYKTNEQYIEAPAYKCTLKGAGFTDDGSLIVDYSFTNSSQDRVVPAQVLAVEAYQGGGIYRMGIIKESMTDETHYLKYYYAEPGQTVDFSAKFTLDDPTDDVIVYLIEPSSGQIYEKKIYNTK